MKSPPFSARTSWDLTENRLTALLAEARAAGRALVDLTESNPTRCGLTWRGACGAVEDARALVSLLGDPRGARYEPLPHGHPDARAAVSRYYEGRGLSVPADRVTLSASTSEAYAWIFKLLTDRGDRVLVPTPSYPLFSFLADLEDVELVPYPLVREEGFRIDLDALRAAIDDRTRAVLLVHPNNPTGSFVRRDEARALDVMAEEHGLALVVDEVFGDYVHGALAPDRLPSFAEGERHALTFVLSGLSKVLALPQLKLGWIATLGPDAIVAEATRRLEMVADTYLSVATPVQLALPDLLAARPRVQAALAARVAENLAALDRAIAALGPHAPVRRLPTDGGWYAILEVPRTHDEEAWVELLVREESAIVHPGFFFDMEGEGFLVVSLLPEPASFTPAIARVVGRLALG